MSGIKYILAHLSLVCLASLHFFSAHLIMLGSILHLINVFCSNCCLLDTVWLVPFPLTINPPLVFHALNKELSWWLDFVASLEQ